MKNLVSSLVSIALLLVLFSFQAIADGGPDAVVGKRECPPGASSDGELTVKGVVPPQVMGSVVVYSEPITEKKQPTPEEIATYQAKVEEARNRDDDRLIKVFTYDSETTVCM